MAGLLKDFQIVLQQYYEIVAIAAAPVDQHNFLFDTGSRCDCLSEWLAVSPKTIRFEQEKTREREPLGRPLVAMLSISAKSCNDKGGIVSHAIAMVD